MAFVSYTTSTNRGVTPRRELGRGGEGIVYELDGGAGLVAKIYHANYRTHERERKVQAMVANPPQDDTRRLSPPHVSIAWPVEILYERRAFVGFLMPLISQSPTIFQIYNPQLREQNPLSFDGRHLHHIAKNLATALNALHARGYVMGDVNQKNILVTTNALVTLVDTDSFQVPDPRQGRTYRCSVGVPEYTPPELQGVNLAGVDREPYHDCFGLSIIIFQMLMEGFHPFTGAPKNPSRSLPGEVYLHCIKQGIFPYQPNREFAPPPCAPDFAALHPEIQGMFVRCFVSGHRAPLTRPTARQWIDALDRAEKQLVQCQRKASHWHSNHTSRCPWCDREARTPLPVQQPFAPPPPRPARAMPQTVPAVPPVPVVAGGAVTPRNSNPLLSLLGVVIACVIGLALAERFSGEISYVPYSPGSHIASNEGPIVWGRSLGFVAGIIAAAVLPLAVWKGDGWPVIITMCIIWIPVGLFVGPLIGMVVGMLLALVITFVFPLALGITLGWTGGALLGVAIERFRHSGGCDIPAWRNLGALIGAILSVIAWANGNRFLADALFLPLFAWVGYAGAISINTLRSGASPLGKSCVLWLALAYFASLVSGIFASPVVLGLLVTGGVLVAVLLTVQRQTWWHAIGGVGCVVSPLVGAFLGSYGEACLIEARKSAAPIRRSQHARRPSKSANHERNEALFGADTPVEANKGEGGARQEGNQGNSASEENGQPAQAAREQQPTADKLAVERQREDERMAEEAERRRQRELQRHRDEEDAKRAVETQRNRQDGARWRTWTVANGEVRAKFLKVMGQTVYLLNKDGEAITVSRDELSFADWYWITHRGWEK